jgi:hypothetical protein
MRLVTIGVLTAVVVQLSQWVWAAPQRGPALPAPRWTKLATRVAQLPRYTASGTHQCGSGNSDKRSCVVTGLFSDCNQAETSLRTRDCCPTTKGGGTSTAFTLTYCIPDYSGR